MLHFDPFSNMRLDLRPPCWRHLWPSQCVYWHPPWVPSHICVVHGPREIRRPLLHEGLYALGVIPVASQFMDISYSKEDLRRSKQLVDDPAVQQMLTLRTARISVHQFLHQIRTHATRILHHVLCNLERSRQHIFRLVAHLCE